MGKPFLHGGIFVSGGEKCLKAPIKIFTVIFVGEHRQEWW